MRVHRSILGSLIAAAAVAGWTIAGSSQSPGQLPMEPVKESGQSVTGAFEGWFNNPDGTISFLLGFFNRNSKEEITIPVGPNNRIEPGGPDQGQPTHFMPRRQWGVFTITVPRDFGDKKLTWTIVANGQTTTIPMSLNPLWYVEPYRHAMGNTPPKIKFDPAGREQQGPPRGFAATLTARVGEPLALTAWISDDGLTTEGTQVSAAGRGAGRGGAEPGRGAETGAARGGQPGRGTEPARGAEPQPGRGAGRGLPAGAGRGGLGVSMSWSKFRGPGTVTFSNVRPAIDRAAEGKATTTATFSDAGEYILRAQVNDASGDGGGGFQCCWTNAHVKVTVGPAGATAK